ncbi:MAG: hypothetical protein FGM15_12070 [Chthoniobacterales bacterium]|nr:hypothetical protein [Chthoniobacterales bacterium]
MSAAPSFLSGFADPPVEFRPWPFLVLNDEYVPGAGEARLTELLESLARVGYGGVFLHPRPGLITEYLSPRWFELIRHCIAECRRLGLVPALYDEHSYPSGFAGGHVPARSPQTASHHVIPKFGKLPGQPPADALAVYRTENGIPVEKLPAGNLPSGSSWCAFVIERMHPMPWHGEFPYTSLLDPQTTEAFLETTYRRYRDELGDDWKSCAAFFTDEPHLTSDGHGPWAQGQHFTRLVQAEFRRRRGYPVEDVLADLYFDSATSAATRFDFYETLHELWFENFALPLSEWCTGNGIPSTGHYLEHDWPCPYATPGHVHLLTRMDWPGTDLLECFLLEGHDYGDPQNLDPAAPGTEPHALYFLKQVQSVANQFGKKRVMNESWGAGGHDSTPLDWLRIGRFLAVHGVNLFVPHYSATTIRGARKKDHPQFFSEQSPWFEQLGPLNDELGRLAWLVARGTTRQRLLVIDPLTTGYCLAAKSDCISRGSAGDAVTDPVAVLADTQRSVTPLRQAAGRFAQALSDAQADFDIGDEYVLAESGAVEGAGLRLGAQNYEVIVLPPGLRNLRRATLALLEAFARDGGKILGCRPENPLLDGRPDDWPQRLPADWFNTAGELLAAALQAVPPRLQFRTPPPAGVAHQRRECGEGIYYLIVNSSPETVTSAVTVPENGDRHLLDPRTGGISPFDGTLELPAGGAVILFAGYLGETPVSRATVTREFRDREPLTLLDARALEPNVLVLDTCALDVGGDTFPTQLVYESNRLFWEKNGMTTNGWTGVIQYRDHVLSANRRMPPSSGGTARYTVRIEAGTDTESIDLCYECPELWRLRVNGQPVETGDLPAWMDCRIGRVPVGSLLRPGENVIELTAMPFDVRQEIDQIYLLGNFSVLPADPGFVLAPLSGPPTLGSWKSQGMPFYDRKVCYRFRRPGGEGRLVVASGTWGGSVLEAACGDRRFQSYGPGLEWDLGYGDAGEISLTVTGLPINLLGPWHKPGLLPKHGWANFWHGGDIPNAPRPGKDYYQLDCGLFALPVWAHS